MFRPLQIRKSLKVKLPSFKKPKKTDCDSSSSAGEANSSDAVIEPPAKVTGAANPVDETKGPTCDSPAPAPAQIVIIGGGIVGLLMALALNKHINVKAEIYEQAAKFEDDVGAGMGLYANGLRVIRDIDPALLREIQEAGHPYLYRRWERHDGTEVAVSDESVLGSVDGPPGPPLKSMGIRRWKLQQCLHAAVTKAGIHVHFGKKVKEVATPENGTAEVVFTDGSRRQAQVLIAADGGRSAVRTTQLERQTKNGRPLNEKPMKETPRLKYTGVTCIMGVAQKEEQTCHGISLPVSNTTQCHGVVYPTGIKEQCFQFHFPISYQQTDVENSNNSSWGNLSQQLGRDECHKLAAILEADGWHKEKYLKPLRGVTKAVKVGFCQLSPALKRWSFPNSKDQPRIILIGDAAHPPVPYIGQGAQQGMEDVGTLSLLLKSFCLDEEGKFDFFNVDVAVRAYENLRIPRVEAVLNNARSMGTMQQKRAEKPAYNIIKEEKIQREVFFHETIPIMFCGAHYDYRKEVEKEVEHIFKQHKGPRLRAIAEV